MKFCWIIPFFLLQGTEAFLMKNAKAKLCLQASPTSGNLLLEDCNPESAFQDWSWQGGWLLNRGTGSCLSLVRTSTLQTNPCSNLGQTSWDCTSSLLSPLGSSQGYLVANKRGVALSNGQGLKAQWQDGEDQSICEQRAAEQEVQVPAALASTHEDEQRAGNSTLGMGMGQEELEELLWFFRTEDASAWNYSVLALSFVATTLGLVLLAINVVQNRKRKSHGYKGAQQAELGAKQALMPVQEYSPTEAEKQELAPQDQGSGEVTVQWKDGTVTSLYTERPEDAM